MTSSHSFCFSHSFHHFSFFTTATLSQLNNVWTTTYQQLLKFFPLGSATLQHWQELAQPNLGGILDPRPGVVPKGYRPLELDLEEVYQSADYEEDEPGEQYFQNLPTTTTPNPNVSSSNSHAPSASSSPCLSTGHPSIEFSSKKYTHYTLTCLKSNWNTNVHVSAFVFQCISQANAWLIQVQPTLLPPVKSSILLMN